MWKWLKQLSSSYWASLTSMQVICDFEGERYMRELRHKAYIRAKAREHIEIMKAVREMEQVD